MQYVKGSNSDSTSTGPSRPFMIVTKQLEYPVEEEREFIGLEFLPPHMPWESHQNSSIIELSISRAVQFPYQKS